jgi:hypothetical protein
MSRCQVADAGMASNTEGSCEYIESFVANSRQSEWSSSLRFGTDTKYSTTSQLTVLHNILQSPGRRRVCVNAVMNLRLLLGVKKI